MINKICFASLFAAGLAGIKPEPRVLFLCSSVRCCAYFFRYVIKSNSLLSYSIICSNRSMTTLLKDGASEFIDYPVPQGAPGLPGECEDGDTALIIACREYNVEAVHMLLSKGADYNVQNIKGFSALHVAIQSGRLECIKLLLSRRYIRVNLQNDLGETPLLLACRVNDTVAVELLLERGADQYITNLVGKNAIQEAGLLKHHDCLQLLLKPSFMSNSSNAYWYTVLNNICDTVTLKMLLLIPVRWGLGCKFYWELLRFQHACAYAFGLSVRASLMYLSKRIR